MYFKIKFNIIFIIMNKFKKIVTNNFDIDYKN